MRTYHDRYTQGHDMSRSDDVKRNDGVAAKRINDKPTTLVVRR